MSKEELIDWNEYPCGANGQMYSHAKKRMLKGNVAKNGYVEVLLKCIDGKRRKFQWHRVIYVYFNGAIPEGMQVNHIDENKQNNTLNNLCLLTPKQNCNYATRNERIASKKRGVPQPYVAERCSKPVVAVDEEGNIVLEFTSIMEAGRQGFDASNVCACCKGKIKHHKGLRWFYKEDYLRMIKGVA